MCCQDSLTFRLGCKPRKHAKKSGAVGCEALNPIAAVQTQQNVSAHTISPFSGIDRLDRSRNIFWVYPVRELTGQGRQPAEPGSDVSETGGSGRTRNRSNNILYRSVGTAEGEIGPETFFTAALGHPMAKWVQQHFLHQSERSQASREGK